MHKQLWAWCALMPLGMTGCATVDPGPGFEAVRDDVARRTGVEVRWARDEEAGRALRAQVNQRLAGELTLPAAMQVSLLNHSRARSALETLGISQAQFAQASTLRNPLLHLSVLDIGAGSEAKLDIGLTQSLFDLLALPARRRMAEQDFDAARWTATAALLDLVGEVRIAWLNAVAAEQVAQAQSQAERAGAASAELAARLHRAGNITDLALANEQAQYLDLLNAAGMAQARARRAKAALTRLLGPGAEEDSWHLPALPEPPGNSPPMDVERLALEANVDLARARTELTRAEQGLSFSQGTRWIGDAEIGWGWEREEGHWTHGPSLGVPLPLSDTGGARVAIASGQLQLTRERIRQLESDIRAGARMARDDLAIARERMKMIDEVMLPLATRMIDASQLEYNAMQIGAFQWLAAKRREIELGRQSIEARRDVWLAHSTLDTILQGRLAESASMSADPMPGMSAKTGGH